VSINILRNIQFKFSIMLKNILKANGVEQLSVKAQKQISGGSSRKPLCVNHNDCPQGYCCNNPQLGICELSIGACR
jgi:hypothetical protein